MSNIICLENKLKAVRTKKDILLQQRKILVVQKALQCYHCAVKCEKCGAQAISECGGGHARSCQGCHAPYRFCEGCTQEYQDYIDFLKGRSNPAHYWQSEAWAESWRRWIDYRGAVDWYFQSKEFNQLVDEMRKNPPEL